MNGEWGIENRNGEWGKGNGERGTGHRGTGAPGHPERESGKECTAVIRLKIQHGGRRKRKGNNLGKCEEVLRL